MCHRMSYEPNKLYYNDIDAGGQRWQTALAVGRRCRGEDGFWLAPCRKLNHNDGSDVFKVLGLT